MKRERERAREEGGEERERARIERVFVGKYLFLNNNYFNIFYLCYHSEGKKLYI